MKAEMLHTDRIIQCYGGTAAEWPTLFGPSTCPQVDQAVADHKLTYDATKAAACLADLAKPLTCDSIWPDSCVPSVLIGAIADGQPCDTGYACGPHSTCTWPQVSDSCPTLICQRTPTLGETCNGICQSGSSCFNGTCVANLTAGAACGQDVQATCGSALFCASSTDVCKPLVAPGGACADNSACWDHQYCDATKHCHDRLDVGGDCSADATSCQSFTACDPSTHRCVAAGHVGQLCGNILGIPYVCAGAGVGVDVACLPDANQVGHCVTPVADGDACAHEYECWSGACTNGVCTAITPNDGAPCTGGADCTSGRCNFGTGVCVAPSPDGADCTDDFFCQSGWCSSGKCKAQGADGAACTDGFNCTSGHCAGGVCTACP